MSGAEDDDTTTAKIERIKKRTSRPERALIKLIRARNGLSENMLNATLVVAALVITAIYQSSLSPPRGLWQVSIVLNLCWVKKQGKQYSSHPAVLSIRLLLQLHDNNISFHVLGKPQLCCHVDSHYSPVAHSF
ncbi:uncharacterized protein LOC108467803 isoform X2 [Gossypium arboreum]|nr:uncharacterized protein LOC108467803 isoform X2 [Gossypium arboreum]